MPTAVDGDVLTYDAALEQFVPKTPGAGMPGSGTVTSVELSGGTTGLTASGSPIISSGTITLDGVLIPAHGGTGESAYTTGDLLYASGAAALSKLPDVATGNALISGGVATAPTWGKIGLATHVSGTLAVANGGTGASSFTAGSVLFSDGSIVKEDNTNLFYDDSLNRLRVNELFINAAVANLFLKDTSTGFQVSTTSVITPQAGNVFRSTSYTSGLVGWNISAGGDAEFSNVDIRGAIHSAVFVYNSIAATAGTLGIFKSAGKLLGNVTIPAAPTYGTTLVAFSIEDQEGISHAASQLFVVNDILRLKDGLVGDTWLKVQAVGDIGTHWDYQCWVMAGTGNVTYRAGLAVADYGQAGAGFIIETADQTNAPFIQMATHPATFTALSSAGTLNVTPQLRIGNLNGSYGYATNVYGFGAGQYGVASTAWITVDQTSGIRIGSNTTTLAQWATNGSLLIGQQAAGQSNIYISAGVLQIRNNTSVLIELASSGSANITGTLNVSTSTGAFALGVTPPSSATVGTGIWIDRTGMYFLNSSIQRLTIDSVGQITVRDWGIVMREKPIYFQNASAQNLGQITGVEVGSGVGGSVKIESFGTAANDASNLYLRTVNYAGTKDIKFELVGSSSQCAASVYINGVEGVRTFLAGTAINILAKSDATNLYGFFTAVGTNFFVSNQYYTGSNWTRLQTGRAGYIYVSPIGLIPFAIHYEGVSRSAGVNAVAFQPILSMQAYNDGTKDTCNMVLQGNTTDGHSFITSYGSSIWLMNRTYYDGTTFRALEVGTSGIYGITQTDHLWYIDATTPAVGSARTQTLLMQLNATGLGIGIAPAYKLQLGTDSAGKPGTSTWTVVSDDRSKEAGSTRPYTRGLADLKKLSPIHYEYNGLAGTPRGMKAVGFIAQEVDRILPELVQRVRGKLRHTDTDETEILGVNNHNLIYMVINALKEIDQRLTAGNL